MKRRLVRYLRGCRSGSGALLIVFVLIPYLVDIGAYNGEGDSIPYATSVNDGKEGGPSEDHDALLPDDGQANSVRALDLMLRDLSTPLSDSGGIVCPPQCLFLASLTSRPPPAL